MSKKIGIVGYYAYENPGKNYINKSFKDLVSETFLNTIESSKIPINDISIASFSFTGEGGIGYGAAGATLVKTLGLQDIPSYINHANCSSGAVALHEMFSFMKNGEQEVGLVCGFDKQTDIMSYENYMLLSTDSDYDYKLGISHIHSFMLADQYAFNKDTQNIKNAMIYFSKLMFENGKYNSISNVYKKNINSDLLPYMPLYGNAVTPGEGAVSLILATKDYAEKNNLSFFVEIEDSVFLSSSQYIGHTFDKKENIGLGHGKLIQEATNTLLKNTEKSISDIGVFGLYDMGLNPLITLEALGICEKGKAAEYILQGNITVEGETPINTDGGNIARGHAAGPGALYQIVELCDQLLNNPKGKKVNNTKGRGLMTSIGGYYATAIATLLKKEYKDDTISE